jgi:hypothetical protein
MYKCYFGKPNTELGKSLPFGNSWIWKLHIRVVPRPTLLVGRTVAIKRLYASPGLPCYPYLQQPRSYVTWLFGMFTAQKCLKQKKSYTNCIPGEVFSLYFLFQDFPPTMMPF